MLSILSKDIYESMPEGFCIDMDIWYWTGDTVIAEGSIVKESICLDAVGVMVVLLSLSASNQWHCFALLFHRTLKSPSWVLVAYNMIILF